MGTRNRLALLAAALTLGLAGPATVQAAPGVPGTTQVLFSEDFENAPVAPSTGPAKTIVGYEGAAPQLMKYTADSNWNASQIRDCNGLVVRGSMANDVFTGCEGSVQADADLMRASAQALALVENPGVTGGAGGDIAKANHAVTAATAADKNFTTTYTGVQLRTDKDLTVAKDRFYNFSVDVAEVFCGGPDNARLFFAKTDSAGANPVALTDAPIVPCPANLKTGGRGSFLATLPYLNETRDVYGGRFPSSGSVLSDGVPFRVRMRNEPVNQFNGGDGNDSAIDNLRVIDATPVVDKRFVAPATGSLRTTLQVFVTNRNDLGAKSGFSFTDVIPAGLSAASQPTVTCFGGAAPATFAASVAGSQITVAPLAGKLAAGDTHCRIDVDVVASAFGTYTASAATTGNRVGVDQGTGDSVTFRAASLPLIAPSAIAAAKPQCSDGRDNDGDAAVDTLDPGCSSAADNNEADESVSDLVLCGRGKIRLVRADAKGRRVQLSGVVAQSLAKRKVTLTSRLGRKSTTLASVTPKADGTFSADVKGPARSQRIKVRYRASVAGSSSVALKLPQTLATSSVRRAGKQIVVKGKVQRNRLGKRNVVQIRRILCGRTTLVGSAKPSKSGAYTVRFTAPSSGDFAFYRAESSVLAKPGSKRYVKQFARGVTIKLGGASG